MVANVETPTIGPNVSVAESLSSMVTPSTIVGW